jgi:hypothetical protein
VDPVVWSVLQGHEIDEVAVWEVPRPRSTEESWLGFPDREVWIRVRSQGETFEGPLCLRTGSAIPGLPGANAAKRTTKSPRLEASVNTAHFGRCLLLGSPSRSASLKDQADGEQLHSQNDERPTGSRENKGPDLDSAVRPGGGRRLRHPCGVGGVGGPGDAGPPGRRGVQLRARRPGGHLRRPVRPDRGVAADRGR